MKTDNISEKLNRVFEELAQSAQEDAQKPRKSTGFPSLDKRTTGLADGDFIMIGSRPAMGKTALVLVIANHLTKERSKTTVLFSLEMSNEQIVHRLQRISGHECTKADNLFIYDDPWITVEKISEICKKIENLSVVIVDYFQLIDDPAYHTENKMHRGFAYSSISRGLKQLARDLMVPVVCTMHLGRQIEHRKDKRPIMKEDLREFGALEQDADQILLLYRDRYYNPETPLGDIAECIVAKNVAYAISQASLSSGSEVSFCLKSYSEVFVSNGK